MALTTTSEGSDTFKCTWPSAEPTISHCSVELAKSFWQGYARQHGFAVVERQTSSNATGKSQTHFMCNRSGSYQPATRATLPEGEVLVRRRVRGTLKTGCRFKIYCSKIGEFWHSVAKELEHNHAPLEAVAFIQHRRPTVAEQDQIEQLSQARVAPALISLQLKHIDPDNTTTVREIYNIRQRRLRTQLGGQTALYRLLEVLDKDLWESRLQVSPTGQFQALFIASKGNLALFKQFPAVLSIDSTYKTNKKRFPLLHMVGMACTNQSFTVALCFLTRETATHFVWALEQLKDVLTASTLPSVILTDRDIALINACKEVYPQADHLLCLWHMNKALRKRANIYLKDASARDGFLRSFANLVQTSPTEVSFEERWITLSTGLGTNTLAIQLVTYIERQWLPFRQSYAFPWTRHVRHFGEITTSRTEGAHSMLKRFIQTSMGSLLTTYIRITEAISHQRHHINAAIQQQQSTIPTFAHGNTFFSEVQNQISHFAFKILFEHYNKALKIRSRRHTVQCTCSTSQWLGIPCEHQLHLAIDQAPHQINLASIDEQWHLDGHVYPAIDSRPTTNLDILLDSVRQHYTCAPSSIQRNIEQYLAQITTMAAAPIEPPSPRTKGRPRGAAHRSGRLLASQLPSSTSTTRAPSSWELPDEVHLPFVPRLTPMSIDQ